MTAQQLKNSILQMAVQGKLVPQDPNDEPASVLLERIRNEKEKLVKAGKIKQKKNPSVIFRGADNIPYEKIGDEVRDISDEIPFEIPDSWEWVRHNDFYEISGGSQPPKSKFIYEPKAGYIRLYQIRDYGKFPAPVYIPISAATKTTEKNDILLARYGASLGKVFWAEEGAYNVAMAKVVPICQSQLHIKDFLFYYYHSDLYRSVVFDNSRSAQAGFNKEDLFNLWLPVPPLAEQQRIVAKIEELLPYIEKYGEMESTLSALNISFPDQLKKSILQQAVQGKLVEQDPNDEPASVLLERIRAEKQRLVKEGKIKKDKHDSVIYRRDNSHYEKSDGIERCIDDEIPFDIPESWEWVRLKTLFNIVSARRVHQSDWRKEGVPFYRAREIGKLSENGVVNNELFINEELYDKLSKSGIPSANDIMMTAVGTLGKTYVVKPTDRFYYKDASVICLENFSNTSPFYIKLAMQSPYMCEQIKECSSGTTVGTVTIVKASDYLIPLPPSCEQKRIVDAYRGIIEFTNKLG